MARYNLIQIGTVYLTNTGLVGGSPCKTDVPELDRLQLAYGGNTVVALSGKPYNFILDSLGEGSPISITVATITSTVFDAIKAALALAVANDATIPVSIDGSLGTFSWNCLPRFSPEAGPIVTPGKFRGVYLFEVTFNFSIVSAITP